ncbi:MAG: hypothetical protein U0Q16_19255 [Bryobacteraceae bacterium]
MRTFGLPLLVAVGVLAETADQAFASLTRLNGDWQASIGTKGAVIRVNLRSISNDTAVVETFQTASGRQTLTIYHADAERLLATHYCAQGNQPRLALDPGGAPGKLVFRFVDATNLKSAGASRLVRLVFDFKDADHFDKTEVYANNGAEEVTVFRFSRVR